MSIANKKPRLFNFVVSILSAMSLPLHIFLTQAVQLLFRKQLTTKSIDISDKETDISVKVTSEGGIALHNYLKKILFLDPVLSKCSKVNITVMFYSRTLLLFTTRPF